MTHFWNKIIHDEENINTEIFSKYFKFQSSTFSLKELYYGDKTENKKLVNNVNNALIELRNGVDKNIPNKENSEKVIHQL